jgi:exopolysaccharide biosynthesis polyprenyl glycosylphosphotransferase
MLKEKDYIFKRANMVVDFLLAGLAFVAAHLLKNGILSPYIAPSMLRWSPLSHYFWLLFFIPPLTVLMLHLNGYYEAQRIRKTLDTIKIILLSVAETTLICVMIIYIVYKGDIISRGQILLTPVILFVLLLAKTFVVRRILVRLRQQGYNFRTLLLVGGGEKLRKFIDLLESHPFWGFRIAGVISDNPQMASYSQPFQTSSGKTRQYPFVGSLDETLSYLEQHSVDEVIFIPSAGTLDRLIPLLEGCEEMGVRTRIALNFFDHTIARPSLDKFENTPLITYNPAREMNMALLLKYTFDRIAACLLLIVLSPIVLATAIAIKLTSKPGAPIFYRQTRCGLNGRTFTLWKFRSMKVGADQELEKLRALSEMDGPAFKLRNDPRVTPVGRLIRRFSIDELPQLWNVLRGEMSLVGPRPPIPEEVKHYDRWQRRRLSMKPGITCLWQVKGRSRVNFDTWMKLDLEYIDNWSLFLDFKILLKTIVVVAIGYGAM